MNHTDSAINWQLFSLVILLIGLAGCKAKVEETGEEVGMSIQLSSSAFKDGETIPKKYSCDGENLSPPLSWGELPQGTRSLALIMDDPDAPVGTFVHWVLFDLPADLSGFPEGGPAGGTDGTNSTRKGGYTGPCPPRGSIHRYYFKLYALDQLLSLETGATKAEVEQTMRDHVLGQGQLMGRFGR